jgi:subtilisin-like proprotein convertase family protein
MGGAIQQGSLASEPGAGNQWHLRNTGQAGGVAGIDINVAAAWESATGRGVRIGILDDGFDLAHPDLAANLAGGWDLLGSDPSPAAEGSDRHGTTVAGVIGADDNNAGLLGIAHDAQLFGFRVGFGTSPLSHFTDAMARQAAMDVSNHSWGFTDPFADDFANPAFAAFAGAIAEAAAIGRGGLGTVFVMAAGNNRTDGDSVNQHNFLNGQYAMAIAALDSSGEVAWFSNPGAALFAAAPGEAILTTDRVGGPGYASSETTVINGTSFAAPMVSGIAALMLQANPGLGYRDVHAIIAASARPVDISDPGWTTNAAGTWNGGGFRFSNDYGFGLVDATAAVRLAESWFATGGSAATAANRATAGSATATALAIPDFGSVSTTLALATGIVIERIELDLDITHSFIGDLSITVTSPSGTQSAVVFRPGLAPGGSGYGSDADRIDFTVSSNAFRGEGSGGHWTVRATDHAGGDVGTLDAVTLRAIGAADTADDTFIYTNAFALLPEAARGTLRDTAGTDTINAAAVSAACVIDLAGLACSIGGTALAIAPGTVIEHAIGGDGADRITGNALANILWGGRGDDTIAAGGGDDTLSGGLGADRLDGGAGLDRALFDVLRAAAIFAWDGATLLVNDGHGIDRLDGIETLVFLDVTIDVAGLLPPVAPADAPAALKFTQSTLSATGAGLAHLATAPPAGSTAVLRPAELGIAGLAPATQVTLASAADGALTVRLDSAWNTLKVATVTDTDGGRISVANFVEVLVDLSAASRDSVIEVLDAKRASVLGGAGADVIFVRALSNSFDGGNTILVDAGAGDDRISLVAASSRTVFRVEGGQGADVITITGPTADIVAGGAGDDRIDAGAGNDRIAGGLGADTHVFRTGSGRDQVSDFADGIDRVALLGIAPTAVQFTAASGGGVRIAWGTADEVVLRGVTLAQVTQADLVFA